MRKPFKVGRIGHLLSRRAIFWRGALAAILARPWVPSQVRVAVLDRVTLGVAHDVRIYAGSLLIGRDMEIGPGVFINNDCRIHAAGPVTIGPNVHLAPGVCIETTTHELGPATRRAGDTRCAAVTIAEGAWIGARSTILPGVTIGRGAVVAAGAVVTRDCTANAVHAGVPAQVIRRLGPDGEPDLSASSSSADRP